MDQACFNVMLALIMCLCSPKGATVPLRLTSSCQAETVNWLICESQNLSLVPDTQSTGCLNEPPCSV